jgi:hypothetical protein
VYLYVGRGGGGVARIGAGAAEFKQQRAKYREPGHMLKQSFGSKYILLFVTFARQENGNVKQLVK